MTEIRQLIRREIANGGAISFARFMELALYCPVYGFYEAEADTIGREGHFLTSVSVGPVFGQLLGCDFANRIKRWGEECSVEIAESGAHDGRLALDILNWLEERRRDVYDRARYTIIEPSERRRAWQSRTLARHGAKIQWISDISGIGTTPSAAEQVPLILFANELLDAFPVHRMQWSRSESRWFEWGVDCGPDDAFIWVPMPQPGSGTLSLLPDSRESSVLPDGYIIEVSPPSVQWWKAAAAAVADRSHGLLMTIDYGFSSEDRLLPERVSGTLRTYRNHRVSTEVLEDPGWQDITAHVDFPALQRAGQEAGLGAGEFLPQGRYLAGVAAAAPELAGGWNAADIRQFKTLTHPGHLGAVFKVLCQSR